MRAVALSVWIFINLVFFGMCGYLYLIWSQYWMHLERQRIFNKSINTESSRESTNAVFQETYSPEKYLQNPYTSEDSNRIDVKKVRRAAAGVFRYNKKRVQNPEATRPSMTAVKTRGSPRFPNIHKPVLELDSKNFVCEDINDVDCEDKSSEYKELLLKEFHRILMTDGNVFKSGLDSQNIYDVKYDSRENRRDEITGKEVLCALRQIPFKAVTAEDEPFKSEGFHIPQMLYEGHYFNTCAIVTSAGALLGSRFGEFIDSHDMVLRFNNAPTTNYSEDVGSKTTYRVLNSQVVVKPEYDFLHNPLFNNISILIWDPSNYSSNLQDWYNNPDFPLFPVYKRLLEERPFADVHLLRPEALWKLWAVLQDSSPYRLRRNPPSSGFIGLWFALHHCDRVRVFEYVPSVRASRQCHYHSSTRDSGCTFGAWHPLAQEKVLAERMRVNSDVQVFQSGYIEVPGFRTIIC